jgi:hypothetical protein
MGPDPPFDFPSIARHLEATGVRFVLFGRQAVRLYGAPVFTQDYDLWVDPRSRHQVLSHLRDDLEFELSCDISEPNPIVNAWAGRDKLDLFFVAAMRDRDGHDLRFDEVYARARARVEPGDGFTLRIPDIDDLICLKRMPPVPRAKDEEDIKYLLVRKDLEAKGQLLP